MKSQSHRNHLCEVTQVTSLEPGVTPKAIFFSFCLITSLVPYVKKHGTSLMVQWLRLCTPNAGGPGLILVEGTRSPMPQLKTWCSQINKDFLKKRRRNITAPYLLLQDSVLLTPAFSYYLPQVMAYRNLFCEMAFWPHHVKQKLLSLHTPTALSCFCSTVLLRSKQYMFKLLMLRLAAVHGMTVMFNNQISKGKIPNL